MPREIELILRSKGFIFDMDGTIINSMKVHLRVWQQILKNYGIHKNLKQVEAQAYGINPEIVRRFFGNKISEEEVENISNEKEELFRTQFDPERDVIKGFFTFIAHLKNIDIPAVIGSAAPLDNIQFFLDRLDMRDYFRGVVHEDDVKRGKPSPEVFLKAAKLINVPVHDCLVFEDSPSGAEASAKAGSQTVVVLSTKSRSDFKDIPGIVKFIKDYTELNITPAGL